ncbi:hypothetical protein SELMODRAFT_425944 [Selaginella moellendorffii]|uniref:Pentacotripeptide-repeat region of PRORP domain-containing protein n=1 Tax=Selaginella moellendorffii TaxID=88036 RepID=D8SUU0_SELML|nr:hypothetical protein SELMODRAFT_425944 [Selaginella moellendorffii]
MPRQNLVSFVTMMCAYAQSGRYQDAEALLDRMPHHDVVSSTSAIHAYAQRGLLLEAMDVFSAMREWSVVACNAMSSQNIGTAEEMFREMTMEGASSPDEISFTWILLECSHSGDLEAGYGWFCSMRMDYGVL